MTPPEQSTDPTGSGSRASRKPQMPAETLLRQFEIFMAIASVKAKRSHSCVTESTQIVECFANEAGPRRRLNAPGPIVV